VARLARISTRSLTLLTWAASVAAEPAQSAEAKVELAVPPARAATKPDRARAHGWGGAGVRGTFGRAFTEDTADGWFGRFELDAFGGASQDNAGGVFGATVGGELWLAENAGGGSLPMGLYFGYRTPLVFSSIGAGFHVFVYDRVDDDGGFGLYAPFGSVALGLDFGPVRVLAEGRATYRWQWGAPDRAQATVGLSLVYALASAADES